MQDPAMPTLPGPLGPALGAAIEAAREAGALLRAELHRAGGPRGVGGSAPSDVEVERVLRARLRAAEPSWGYLGEELGHATEQGAHAPTWIVDPNDGTVEFVSGARGSAVSIGAVRDGIPVLGVVYAFAYPDDDGDLFAWAEGAGPARRNGAALPTRSADEELGRLGVVMTSCGAHKRVGANLACVAPGRFRALPSIAHRLALVAASEADVATAIAGTQAWDLAAGHALLRGVGCTLLREDGSEVRYGPNGSARVAKAFGGPEAACRVLLSRSWQACLRAKADVDPIARPAKGTLVAHAGRLARAQGAVLGQLAGDALGSLVEFEAAERIALRYPDGGPRALADGGTWDTIAGQPTDDSELALALARSIAEAGGFDALAAIEAYAAWYASHPFDIGSTTAAALGAAARARGGGQAMRAAALAAGKRDSQANGSLMRVSPLGIWGAGRSAAEIAEAAREDSALTHPHAACQDACAAFAIAIAHAIEHGDGPDGAYTAARAWAEQGARDGLVLEALAAARERPPASFSHQQGWVRTALHNAFYRLLNAPTLEQGVVDTVRAGGDTDTNGAIAGALLGAVHGRASVPLDWRRAVLTCRAHKAYGARRPRPSVYWPVDALELAERVLACSALALAERPARRP